MCYVRLCEGRVLCSVKEVAECLETMYVTVTVTFFIYSSSMLKELFHFALHLSKNGIKISLKCFEATLVTHHLGWLSV